MHSHFARPLTINWDVTALEVSGDGIVASAVCQKCRKELEIHQPQEDNPQELLATCGECGRWHLIQVASDSSEAWMFNLPGIDFIRETLARHVPKVTTPKRAAGPAPRGRGKSRAKGSP